MITAIIGSVLILCIALFYLLLAFGLPFGEFTWGGRFKGVLPLHLRISCGVSVLFQILAVIVLLQAGNVFSIGLSYNFVNWVIWFFAVYFPLNTLMNIFSKSKK